MDRQLVDQLATELKNFQIPTVETIFAGNDFNGAHIYVAYNAEVNCLDAVGFAAIGNGSRHTSSELMFARHTIKRPFCRDIFACLFGKKES